MARRLTEIVQVRFTMQDLEQLKKLAAIRGICLAAMIRMTMVQKLAAEIPAKRKA